MALLRFQNHLRFALRKEGSKIRDEIPLNRPEKIGNLLSWLVYEFKVFIVNIFSDPRFITVCFTGFAILFTALLFYPFNTWDILSSACGSIVDRIKWSYVRFGLWLVSEITIFGLGIRAFGRFSNPRLMEYHGIAS